MDGSIAGRVNWYNLSNPRSPSLIMQVTVGNKPHMVGFWSDRMIDGFQDGSFRIWDFDDKTIAGTFNGSVSPVWYMVQAPYVFRPRNGYGSGANNMEIAKVTNTGGTSLGIFDLGTVVGFPVGALHAVGNVLVCSASQAPGVATLDISDPANPTLLDQLVTGGSVYTSMVYGTRIYQCEQGEGVESMTFQTRRTSGRWASSTCRTIRATSRSRAASDTAVPARRNW